MSVVEGRPLEEARLYLRARHIFVFLPADSYLDTTGIPPIFPESSAIDNWLRWPGASFLNSSPSVAITLPFLRFG